MIYSRNYLKLAQKVAKEALEEKDGLYEVIAVLYLKAAYGHVPVATYERMYEEGVLMHDED